MTEIVLIAAVADNGVIGAGDTIPWHLPEDLRRFRRLTLGHPMVMGRKTFESIGRPLPGRDTIVVTRDEDWTADGVRVAHSVDEALATATDRAADGVAYVAGGGQIYALTIDGADRLEVTHVDAAVEGDTVFPTIDPAMWAVERESDGDGCRFVTYRRRSRHPVR